MPSIRTARLLLITAFGIHFLPQEGLTQIENAMNINIQKEVKCSFNKVLVRFSENLLTQHDLDSDLFDVALEGLSYVWLKYPHLISEKLKELEFKANKNDEPLLKVLLNSMLAETNDEEFAVELNHISLKAGTKAQILRTFTRFLTLHEQNDDFSSETA